MKSLLRKLAVRTKLLSSFMLLASFVLILGVTATIIQKSLEKNQKETLASINLSDAFFEGKYFLRSDMHIFTELMASENETELSYWWGEHDFQVMFFNDQLQKVENEFLVNKSFETDTLQKELLSITGNVSKLYDHSLLPVFNKFKVLKEKEIQLFYELSDNRNLDSLGRIEKEKELNLLIQKYTSLNKEITTHGLEIITNLDEGKDLVRLVIGEIQTDGQRLMGRTYNIFLIFTVLGVLFSVFIAFYISKLITRPVNKILKHVNLLGKGEHPEKLDIIVKDEFGAIQESLNTLTGSLVETSEFSKEIGEGNFESSFKPMGDNDILGNSLLQMRDSLNKARKEIEERHIEDERRSWAANGIAKFGDIMRQSGETLDTLGYHIISNLIDYVGAIQGALFVINDENPDDIYYELISAIAYSREKHMTKEIRVGEGLVGRVAHEEKTIYLKEIPKDYVNITSGLGTSNPSTILLIPVKLENRVNGVIELVSFKEFEPYQIDFIEKVGENIASFVASIKINEKTATLLTESQHKSEELSAQEEEMRQNMEELQATQEEAARREEERNLLWDSLGKMIGVIETDISGNIINTNEKISRMLGVGHNDLNDSNYKLVFFKDKQTEFESLLSQVVSGSHVSVESVWESTGIKLLHELSLVSDVNGKGSKVLALIKEISV